jgi:GNAT superfamily N-acetyltransferase
LIVRPAGADDRPFIVEMARLACVIEERPLPAPESADVAGLLPSPTDHALLATNDKGRPIGAAWWYFHTPPLLSTTDGRPLPEMVVAVIDRERGQGVGTTLIEALAADAATRFTALSLNVHLRNPAARLYTRTGFQVAGKGRGPFGVAMVRQVAAAAGGQGSPKLN